MIRVSAIGSFCYHDNDKHLLRRHLQYAKNTERFKSGVSSNNGRNFFIDGTEEKGKKKTNTKWN